MVIRELSQGFSKSDDIGSQYLARADDESLSAKEREASVLLSMAESHISEPDGYAEAKNVATRALEMFRSIGNNTGAADSLRVILHAYRVQAEMQNFSGKITEKIEARQVLKEAEKLAKEELAKAQQSGDGRVEAAMNLSIAEILLDTKSRLSFNEAFKNASKAQLWFSKAGDKKFEGIAFFIIALIHFNKGSADDTIDAASKALTCSRDSGDRKAEAKALHSVALAYHKNYQWREALTAAIEAMGICQEIDWKKYEAFECNMIANWYLYKRQPQEAVPYARRAYTVLCEEDYAKGWQAVALTTVVKALLDNGDACQALRFAKDGVARFGEIGDKRSEVFATDAAIQAYIVLGDIMEAQEMAEQALELCRSLGDAEWEAIVYQTISTVHRAANEMEDAHDAAQKSLNVLKDMQDCSHIEMATALEFLGDSHVVTGNYREAFQCYDEALDLVQKLDMRIQEAQMLLKLAHTYRVIGKHENADESVYGALEIFQEEHEKRGESTAYQALTDFSMQAGDIDQALDFAHQRRECAKILYDKRIETDALQQICGIYLQLNNPREAKQYALQAKALMQSEADKIGEAYTLMTIMEAISHLVLGPDMAGIGMSPTAPEFMPNIKEALKYGRQLLSVAQMTPDRNFKGLAAYFNAHAHFMNNSLGDALQSSSHAIKVFRKASNQHGEALAVLLQARAFSKGDKLINAMEAATAAIKLFQDCGDEEGAEKAMQLLASLKEKVEPKVIYAQGVAPAQMQVAPTEAAATSHAVEAVAQKQAADPKAVMSGIMDVLSIAVGDVSGVSEDSPLMESGLDSLSSIQYKSDLSKQFNVQFPASLIFDYPTPAALQGLVMQLLES